MKLKSSFIKLIQVLILLLPAFFSNGQVINDRSHIHVKGGGILYVSGSFENRSSATNDTARVVVENASSIITVGQDLTNNSGAIHLIDGEIHVNNYKSQITNGDSALLINQRGKVFVSGGWNDVLGDYVDTVTSEFHLNGVVSQEFNENKTDLYRHVFFEGGGEKIINGHLVTNKAQFINGIVKCDVIDTFAIMNITDSKSNFYGSDVIGGSNASHVEGPLWIEGQTKIDFPIGIGGIYRPLNFSAIPALVLIKAEVIQNITPNPVGQLEQVFSDIAWSYATPDSLDFLGSSAQITFHQNDTIGKGLSPNLVVAQGWQPKGDYVSLKNGGTSFWPSNISLTTLLQPGQAQILAIGSGCASSKLSLLVKLEGAYRGGAYEANALNTNELNRFEFGGAGYYNMLQGYAVPTSAVDLIKVYIREPTSPYNYIDTAVAWAMNDGSIRDMLTGDDSYVEFCDAKIVNSNPYMVEVRHRNHVSIMTGTGSPYVANSNIPNVIDAIDLTNPTNLYGLSPAQDIGGEMFMYKGNTFSVQNDQEVNSLDLIYMVNDVKKLSLGYLNTDVNLDGAVDGLDYNSISSNALNLKMSSVP